MIGTRMHLKPRPGLVIRDPGNRGRLLPQEGRVVVVDEFWLRRIAEEDVVAIDPVKRKISNAEPSPADASPMLLPPEPTET